MAGGKLTLVSKGASRPTARSVNIVNKPTKWAKRKRKTRPAPSKSFMSAYLRALPSKEVRFLCDKDLVTANGSGVYQIVSGLEEIALHNIVQGTQMNHRLGTSIHCSYLKVRGSIQNKDQGTVGKTRNIRMIVVQERNNGTLNPGTFANFFKDSGFSDRAPTGKANNGRFTINREQYYTLFDRNYRIKPESENSTFINRTIKINRKLYYPQANPASNDPVNGKLYFITMLYEGDDNLSTVLCHVELQLRLFFKDHRKIM